MKKLALCAFIALTLTACALTPEEKAKREAEQQRAQQELQIHLASQCDTETANLMRQHFENKDKVWENEEEQQTFRLQYLEKINNPLFQSCYKMAWQNYISQRQLERIERDYLWYEHDLFWHRPFIGVPYYYPRHHLRPIRPRPAPKPTTPSK